MTDVVKRAREYYQRTRINLVIELADEVERLRKLQVALGCAEDEIERLRAIIAEYEDKIMHADHLRGPRGEPGSTREVE